MGSNRCHEWMLCNEIAYFFTLDTVYMVKKME